MKPKSEMIRYRQKIIYCDDQGRPIREEWLTLSRPAPKRVRKPRAKRKIESENPPGYVHPLIIKTFERNHRDKPERVRASPKPKIQPPESAGVKPLLYSSLDTPKLEEFFDSLAQKREKGQV